MPLSLTVAWSILSALTPMPAEVQLFLILTVYELWRGEGGGREGGRWEREGKENNYQVNKNDSDY